MQEYDKSLTFQVHHTKISVFTKRNARNVIEESVSELFPRGNAV